MNGFDHGEPGTDVYFEERLMLYRVNVHPENVVSIDNTIAQISELNAIGRSENHRACIRVAADHPLCPTICDAIEESGFRFCGILPMSVGRDYMMFSEFDSEALTQLSLYTQTAKQLRDYLIRCS